MIAQTLHDPNELIKACDTMIYIRDDAKWTITREILSGRKELETRTRDVFKQIANPHHRVGILIRIGKRLFFIGSCVLSKWTTWKNGHDFLADYELHRIGKDSPWFKPNGGVGYLLGNPRFCFPTPYEKPENAVGNRSYFKIIQED